MSLSQLLLVLLLAVMTLTGAVGAGVVVHRRPAMHAPITAALGVGATVAAVLTVLLTATR